MPVKKGKPHSGQFQKGVSGNPSGRAKLPEELKHLIKTTGQEYMTNLCYVMSAPHGDIQALSRNMETPSALKAMASCMDNCIATGDAKILHIFSDRLLGKVKEQLEITHLDDQEQAQQRDKDIDLIVAMLNDRKPNASKDR